MRRVVWRCWILVILAVSAMAVLSAALGARPSPATAITIAADEIVLACSIALALPIWLVLGGRRR